MKEWRGYWDGVEEVALVEKKKKEEEGEGDGDGGGGLFLTWNSWSN